MLKNNTNNHNFHKITYHYLYIYYGIFVFIAINILNFAWLGNFNIDFTQEKRFSVSHHSLKIIDTIPEHVDLNVYVSSSIFTEMPTLKSYVDRVQDFLRQLAKHSAGRLRVSITEIEPFSEQEDQAVALGLKAVPFKEGEGVFFGIIASNMLDGEGVIPFLSPEREAFIEYDIARLIQGVIQTNKTKIAISSSLPLETGSGGTAGVLSGQSRPYYVFQSLNARYDLVGLSSDYQELLDKKNRPKVALILHPRRLNSEANKNLQEYVATGGRVLITVDPFNESLPLPIGSQQQNPEIYSNMPDFFKFIGLSYDNQSIILDRKLARKIINPQTSRFDEYLAWLKFTADNFNRQHPTMTSINDLSFSTVGLIGRDKNYKGNLEFTPLIYNLKQADVITRDKMLAITNPDELGENYQEKIPYNSAMLVTGAVDSATKDKNSKDKKNTAIIVISDSDFLDDRLWIKTNATGTIEPFADNINLVLNYVDYLAGDDNLIALRGKKVKYRPLTYLDNIKRIAEEKFIAQEKILKQKIHTLQKDIAESQKNYSKITDNIASEKIKQQVQQFSQELVISRKELREVRRNVNRDIKNSERNIKLMNIIVMPLCFAILALCILSIRKSKSLKRNSGG